MVVKRVKQTQQRVNNSSRSALARPERVYLDSTTRPTTCPRVFKSPLFNHTSPLPTSATSAGKTTLNDRDDVTKWPLQLRPKVRQSRLHQTMTFTAYQTQFSPNGIISYARCAPLVQLVPTHVHPLLPLVIDRRWKLGVCMVVQAKTFRAECAYSAKTRRCKVGFSREERDDSPTR